MPEWSIGIPLSGINLSPMYYVYVLQSVQSRRYYIGSTEDYGKRLKQHNAGLTKSTKSYRPYVLVYIEEFAKRGEALKREKQIKRYKSGNEFKKLIDQHR